jgi:hypothetical protein
MDRREALKSFLALPAAATISRHRIQPGEIAIMELPDYIFLSPEESTAIRARWGELIPDIPLVILEKGTKLTFAQPPKI